MSALEAIGLVLAAGAGSAQALALVITLLAGDVGNSRITRHGGNR